MEVYLSYQTYLFVIHILRANLKHNKRSNINLKNNTQFAISSILTIYLWISNDLKIQKYMSEIAGDAFFWVYFSKCSLGAQLYPLIREGYTSPVIDMPLPLRGLKMTNNTIRHLKQNSMVTLNLYV